MSERHSTSRVSSIQSAPTPDSIEFEGYPKEFHQEYQEWQASIPNRNVITPEDIAYADRMEAQQLAMENADEIRRVAEYNARAASLITSALFRTA